MTRCLLAQQSVVVDVWNRISDVRRRRRRRRRPCRVKSTTTFSENDEDAFQSKTPNNTTKRPTTFGEKPIEDWSLSGLRAEAQRQEQKAMKKVSQATTKLRKGKEKMEALLLLCDRNASVEDLEQKCPDVDVLETDVKEKKTRLEDVRRLTALLGEVGKKVKPEDPRWIECVKYATTLDISDAPPPRPPRGPKKVKNSNQNTRPRRPYFAYSSTSNAFGDDSNANEETTVEIRVGRTSEDNDIVSLDPTNDPNEWWMHAAGCPGSHVVIKSKTPSDATFLDAALLAAKFSKAARVGRVKVSAVRCRQVSKPKGAKPGLVRLSGDVRTIEVRLDESASRVDALERTKT